MGGDLLSHTVSRAVPSALEGLACIHEFSDLYYLDTTQLSFPRCFLLIHAVLDSSVSMVHHLMTGLAYLLHLIGLSLYAEV